MLPDSSMRNVAAPLLIGWAERVFQALGCADMEASQVARGLVQANLYGHDSHGIGLVPQYVQNVRAGHAVAGRTPRVVTDAGSIVALDGGRGFGQANGEAAMNLVIERVRRHGSAVVGLADTHHLGRIGHWGEQCAASGLVSVHFVNVRSRPIVAPWGGSDARVSTNPFCIAVPYAPHPLVLDYATAAVALGKTRVAVDEGKPMADGMLIDHRGAPTTDPSVMFRDRERGAILPFGQHKGWALSVMCELLGGALTGGHVQNGTDVLPFNNNMLTLAFDPARLGTASVLGAEIEKLAAWVRGSPALVGRDGVLLPGEPERRTAVQRAAKGVPMPVATLAMLASTADGLGIDSPWKDRS